MTNESYSFFCTHKDLVTHMTLLQYTLIALIPVIVLVNAMFIIGLWKTKEGRLTPINQIFVFLSVSDLLVGTIRAYHSLLY